MHKKIAIFLPSLHGGGAERVMVTLANGFARRGFQVDLVLASAKGPYLSDVSPQVRIVDLRAQRVLKAWLPLMRYLRQERPVALLSAMNHANVVAVLAQKAARSECCVVVSEHSTISVQADKAQGWVTRGVYALVPWLYRGADTIVAVSHEAARDLEQFTGLPAGSVQAIYNPFDLRRIQYLGAQPVEHPWLQAKESRPIIMAVGRLTEPKDFPTLLRAFVQVRIRHSARLLILGEGALRNDLEMLARNLGLGSDDVQMPGFVSNPFAYLAKAALFVLSSRWEGFGNVLVEAMACGVPVVSTDCPSGPREILQDGRWGRLVPVRDADALAHAMCDVLATPRAALPDVRVRAQDFEQERAIDAYLAAMGLPRYPGGQRGRVA